MASKESARTRGISAQLEALRAIPPGVRFVTSESAEVNDNSALLAKIQGLAPATHKLSPLIDDVCHMNTTILKVGNVRYNKWGKFEIYISDKAKVLSSMKASHDEIDRLCWRPFTPSGEEQSQVIHELAHGFAENVFGDRPPRVAVKLMDINFMADNAAGEANAGFLFSKKQIVYGKWQIVKYVPSTPLPSALSRISADSAASVAAAAAVDKEPPKKRQKKNPKASSLSSEYNPDAASSSVPMTVQEGPYPMGSSDGKDQEECVQE